MKVKPFALAGIGSLAVAGTAMAAFTGIAIELYTGGDDAQNWLDNGYSGLATYRLYADFDGQGDDGVLAVFGIGGLPLSLNSSDGTFSNDNVFGGDTPPNDFRPAMIWSAEWDTFVTIGASHAPEATGLSPGFGTLTGNLSQNWVSENAGWFVTPDDAQSMAVDGRVLLGQFSVADTGGDPVVVSGIANLQLRDGSQQTGLEFTTAVPAPGALALLGLAGLVGTRRRRA